MTSSRFQWKTQSYPAPAIFLGLLAAQLIATFQVYCSNRSLYHSLKAIQGAGYLTVPNQLTIARLQELTTALWGGIFLTLSVGAGLCLLSFVAAWAWDRVFFRKTGFLVFLLLLWAGLAAGFNRRGFSLFGSLYIFAIPPVVFAGALKWMPINDRKKLRRNGLLQTIPIIVLGLLWAPQMKKDLFYDIRDHLLLSNPFGERIVDFYYQYTLCPAEALKSLDQKLLKTCSLDGIGEKVHYKKELREKLLDRDWLETGNFKGVDLILNSSENELSLEDEKGTVLKIPTNGFLSNPGAALKQFSFLTDRNRFFRQFTFYSLLVGFPVTLYLFLYAFFFFFLGKWPAPAIGPLLCATLSFITALLFLMPLWLNNEKPILEKSKDRSVSKINETHKRPSNLLMDPSPLVVSSALSHLRKRGDRTAIPEILRCMETSKDWYVQWYAYKALKALGWKQKKKAKHEKDQ
jgi:hypothetical protein